MATEMTRQLLSQQKTRMRWTREEIINVLAIARRAGRFADFTDQDFTWIDPATHMYIPLRLDALDARHARFTRANMAHVSLIGASLHDAILVHANLQEADLSSAMLDRANCTAAHMDYTSLARAHVNDSNFTHARLFGANLEGINGLTNRAALRSPVLSAKYYPIARTELFALLTRYPHSAQFLETAVLKGVLDGAVICSSDGFARDIYGWIEYAIEQITAIPEREYQQTIRQLLLSVGRGDTPSNNPVAMQFIQWLREY